MDKSRNRRNWFIVVLMFTIYLVWTWNNGGWLVGLAVSAVIALVTYVVFTRWEVL